MSSIKVAIVTAGGSGMGAGAGYAALRILAKFGDEFKHYITHKRSLCDGNLEWPAST